MRFEVTALGLAISSLLLACADDFSSGEGGGGAATTTTTTTSTGGSGGSGQGGNVDPVGCSDGTRELFTDATAEPDIAGCQGGFQLPGVTTSASQSPKCERVAGNDSTNPLGEGCSVADLCAEGWHVCDTIQGASDAMQGDSCPATMGPSFWITRISTAPQTLNCQDQGNDNLVGCGTMVGAAPTSDCGPLNTVLIFSTCDDELGAWDCGATGDVEAEVVVKDKMDEGGVLCCKN